MNNYRELPYSVEDFREWLRSLPESSSIAGHAGQSRSCPAAKWLTDTCQREARVESEIIWIGKVFTKYNTPEWLTDFVGMVDEYGQGESIERDLALELLTRVGP